MIDILQERANSKLAGRKTLNPLYTANMSTPHKVYWIKLRWMELRPEMPYPDPPPLPRPDMTTKRTTTTAARPHKRTNGEKLVCLNIRTHSHYQRGPNGGHFDLLSSRARLWNRDLQPNWQWFHITSIPAFDLAFKILKGSAPFFSLTCVSIVSLF